ncbi:MULTISPECIES: LuxR family transcriptional regulator [Gluconobacter]|nr:MULTISPECIES: LuxR family transcriptional regulator [Gluconobacter]
MIPASKERIHQMENHIFITKNIYKTIEDRSEWNEALVNIAKYCTDSSFGGASLIPLDEDMSEWRFGSNQDPKTEELYYNHWRNKSPLSVYTRKKIENDFLYVDDSFLSDKQIDKIPFYMEFLREFGVRRIHHAMFKTENGNRFLLSVQSPDGLTIQSSAIIKQNLTRIIPHVIQAVGTGISFNKSKNFHEIFENSFKEMPFGIALINSENKIVYANNNLIRMESDGIFIKNNTIQVKSSDGNSKFSRLLSGSGDIHNPIKIKTETDKIFFAKVINVSSKMEQTRMVIFSIHRVNSETEAILSNLFLTASQSKIACLIANGNSIKDSSLKMNITEGTARQMVKDIFVRLGVNSQSQLTAFVKNISFIA